MSFSVQRFLLIPPINFCRGRSCHICPLPTDNGCISGGHTEPWCGTDGGAWGNCNCDDDAAWRIAETCCYEVACGSADNTNCDETPHCAAEAALHEVRCCSDAYNPGWSQHDESCPWAASDLGSGCARNMNHGAAVAYCAAEGGRLCTKAELEADCTKFSGCTHDDELIWSSTGHETACSTTTVAAATTVIVIPDEPSTR